MLPTVTFNACVGEERCAVLKQLTLVPVVHAVVAHCVRPRLVVGDVSTNPKLKPCTTMLIVADVAPFTGVKKLAVGASNVNAE
jgi:hypothetical protein